MVQVQQRASEIGKALDLLQLLNEGGEVTNMMGEISGLTGAHHVQKEQDCS